MLAWSAKPAAGNRNALACACSPRQVAWRAADGLSGRVLHKGLLAAYPDARVVLSVRDGRAGACSTTAEA